MQEVNLFRVQELCTEGKIIWKDHAAKRMKERNIKTADVENCISTGEIIEQYSNDYPAPSCLLLGLSINNQYLHVVCSVHAEMLCIITSYYPNLHEWEADYKTRKVVN